MTSGNKIYSAGKRDTLKTIGLIVIAVPLVALALPFLVVHWLWWLARAGWLSVQVRLKWYPEKNCLFVYSDSPNWKPYIEGQILPHLANRAVILNWSERSQWLNGRKPLAVRVFLHWANVAPFRIGTKLKWEGREYNPLAVVFAPWWRPRRIKLWRAFKELKHGRPSRLKELEAQLFAAAGVSGPGA